MKKIKVFLDCDLYARGLERIFQSIFQTIFVTSPVTADVIVVDEVSKIRPVYDPSKEFVIISEQGEAPFTDGNIKVMTPHCPAEELLRVLVDVIDNLGQNSEEIVIAEPEEQTEPDVIIQLAPWVLIVADDFNNRLQARVQLGSTYNLTVVKGYDEAIVSIASRLYDYALIDLYLSLAHSPLLSAEATIKNLEVKIPYGFMLLFNACGSGANSCLISNRKSLDDPLASIFQTYLDMYLVINDKRARLCYEKVLEDGSRDWLYILSRLTQVNL
jgi:hypothetical protein